MRDESELRCAGGGGRRAPRAAVRRHRSVRRAPRGVGSARRRQGSALVLPDLRRGVRRGRAGDQATGGLLRAARFGRAWPSSSGCWSTPRRRGCWCWPTPSVGTSTRPRRPTPTPGWARAAPLAADAVTVHPYLGLAALAPLVQVAGRTGRGVIVVTRSSNPEGRLVAGGGDASRASRSRTRSWPRSPPGTTPPTCRRERWAPSSGPRLPRSAFPLSPAGRGNSGARTGSAGGAAPKIWRTRFAGCAPRNCPCQHLAEPPRDRARIRLICAGRPPIWASELATVLG